MPEVSNRALYISIHDIENILGLEQDNRGDDAIYHSQESGPGRLDFNLAIAGDDNPWVSFDALAVTQTTPLQAIILSIPTARVLERSLFDELFIKCLLDNNIAVYVWEDADTFENSLPLNNLDEIWSRLQRAAIESIPDKQSIQKALAKIASRDTQSFAIFDIDDYMLLRTQEKSSKNPLSDFPVTELFNHPELLVRILKNKHPLINLANSLSMHDLARFKQIAAGKAIRNYYSIIDLRKSEATISEYTRVLKITKVDNVWQRSKTLDKIPSIKEDANILAITIKGLNFKTLKLPKKIKVLVLELCEVTSENGIWDLREYDELEELSISGSPCINENLLKLLLPTSLKKLTLCSWRYEICNFEECENLWELNLRSEHYSQIKKFPPKLKSIVYGYDTPPLPLSVARHIRKLECDSPPVELSNFLNLEELIFRMELEFRMNDLVFMMEKKALNFPDSVKSLSMMYPCADGELDVPSMGMQIPKELPCNIESCAITYETRYRPENAMLNIDASNYLKLTNLSLSSFCFYSSDVSKDLSSHHVKLPKNILGVAGFQNIKEIIEAERDIDVKYWGYINERNYGASLHGSEGSSPQSNPLSIGHASNALLDSNMSSNTQVLQDDILLCILVNGQVVDSNDYRFRLLSNVTLLQNRKVSFNCSPVTDRWLKIDIETLNDDADSSSENAFANMQINTLTPGQYCSLGCLRVKPVLDSFQCAHAQIELYLNPDDNQYYIINRSHTMINNIKIEYTLKAGVLSNTPTYHQLPPNLRSIIARFLDEHPPIKNCWDPNNAQESFRQLSEYFKTFRNAQNHNKDDDIDSFLAMMANKIGACRHRANMLFLLASYFDHPALLCLTSEHATTEVFVNDRWQHYDMGGVPGEFLCSAKTKAFKQQTLQKFANKPATKLPTSLPHEQNPYLAIFEDMACKHELNDLSPLLTSQKPPLLLVNSFEKGRSLYEAMLASTKLTRENSLYIEHREEFIRYYETHVVRDGCRRKIDGPLKKLIQADKPVTLVINWSNMKDLTGQYKSLIDKPPRLHLNEVNAQVSVINLVDNANQCNEAFVSRCQLYKLSMAFNLPETQISPKEYPGDVIEVNCFSLPFWREFLLEKFTPGEENKIIRIPGALEQAINENRPLRIINPPVRDAAFDRMLYRFQTLRQVMLQGELKAVPDHCYIECVEQMIPVPDNITVNNISEATVLENCIVLNEQTYPDFIEPCFIHEDGSAEIKPSLLSQTHRVMVTTELPTPLWKHICAVIAANFQKNSYEFLLPPGTSLGMDYQNNADFEPINHLTLEQLSCDKSTVIVTEDASLCVHYLKTRGDEIIHMPMNEMTQSQDCLVQQQVYAKNDGPLEFREKRLEVFKGLTQGKTVVLEGEISPTFWQALLPYFLQTSIFYQGQDFPISGKLIVITSPTSANIIGAQFAKASYLPINWLGTTVFDHYLTQNNKNYQIALNLLKKYIHWQRLLPDGGDLYAKPKPPSYLLLKMSLAALFDPHYQSHKNPLKQLWGYAYPKECEVYSKVNVWGKYLFHDYQDPVIVKMFLSLVSRVIAPEHVSKQKIWDFCKANNLQHADESYQHRFVILNAFPATVLRNILNATKNSPPDISLEKWCGFFASKIAPILKGSGNFSAKVKPGRVEKRVQRTEDFLNNKDQHFLFLMGPQGTGKTYSVRESLKNQGYQIFEKNQIELWLKQHHPKSVLLIDEANLYQPGSFDFFKSLAAGENYIIYNGVRYQRPKCCKVIFTGNSSRLPGRYHHSFFSQVPYLYCDLPNREFLKAAIVEQIFTSHAYQNTQAADLIINNFLEITKIHATTSTVSLRDLRSVAERFVFLIKTTDEDVNATVRKAFSQEFSQFFMTHSMEAQPVKIADKIFPRRWQAIIEAIETAIQINKASSIAGSAIKRGILIEGPRGIGKTSLFQSLATKHGLDSAQITVGTPQLREQLVDSFHQGKFDIVDELNLGVNTELLMNTLLDNVDTGGNPAIKPGFMMGASQNPGYYTGTKAVSSALLNRFQRFELPDLNREDLLDILSESPMDEKTKKLLVDAFIRVKARYPDTLDSRSFFQALENMPTLIEQSTQLALSL